MLAAQNCIEKPGCSLIASRKDTPAETLVELLIMKPKRLDFDFEVDDWEALIREALENFPQTEFTVWELEKPVQDHTHEIENLVADHYL